MRRFDPQRSRAVLIGASRYTADPELSPLPAVRNNLEALRAVLTDRERCGFPREHCTVRTDPEDSQAIGRALSEAGEAADDLLLVYYAGHGLVDRQGELYLGLTGTSSNASMLPYTGVPYGLVRRSVRGSRAANRVVILDCCFSGRAIDAATGPEAVVAGQVGIQGAYTLTSSSRTSTSIAAEGRRFTAFTGELLRILVEGIPGGPEFLTLDVIYEELHRGLVQAGLPEPHVGREQNVHRLALARNAAETETQAHAQTQAQAQAETQAQTQTQAQAQTETQVQTQAQTEAQTEAQAQAQAETQAQTETEATLVIGTPPGSPPVPHPDPDGSGGHRRTPAARRNIRALGLTAGVSAALGAAAVLATALLPDSTPDSPRAASQSSGTRPTATAPSGAASSASAPTASSRAGARGTARPGTASTTGTGPAGAPTVPTGLVGAPLGTAVDRLSQLKIPFDTQYEPSADRNQIVLRIGPGEGTQLGRDQHVRLYVARQYTRIPDLVGLTRDELQTWSTGSGVRLETPAIKDSVCAEQTCDTAVSQSRKACSRVFLDETVVVTLGTASRVSHERTACT